MIERDYFSHTIKGTDHNVFWYMQHEYGYCFKVAGENIGTVTWNGASEEDATNWVFDAFMKSEGHRANIMGKAWDVVAVGAYKRPGRQVHVDGAVRRRVQLEARTRRRSRPQSRPRSRRPGPSATRRRSRIPPTPTSRIRRPSRSPGRSRPTSRSRIRRRRRSRPRRRRSHRRRPTSPTPLEPRRRAPGADARADGIRPAATPPPVGEVAQAGGFRVVDRPPSRGSWTRSWARSSPSSSAADERGRAPVGESSARPGGAGQGAGAVRCQDGAEFASVPLVRVTAPVGRVHDEHPVAVRLPAGRRPRGCSCRRATSPSRRSRSPGRRRPRCSAPVATSTTVMRPRVRDRRGSSTLGHQRMSAMRVPSGDHARSSPTSRRAGAA